MADTDPDPDDRAARAPESLIAASAIVAAPTPAVYAFLAEGDNHRRLTGRRVELVELHQDGDEPLRGTMLFRGPLRIRRYAHTRVLTMHEPHVLAGTARIGPRTRAVVRWDLQPTDAAATRVTLSAALSSVGLWDRLLLAAGGTRWIRALLHETIARLAAEAA